jgi:hypothetical protein
MAKQYGRVVITRFGGPEVLEIVREDLREARPGEVRVRVLAAGVAWVEPGGHPRDLRRQLWVHDNLHCEPWTPVIGRR